MERSHAYCRWRSIVTIKRRSVTAQTADFKWKKTGKEMVGGMSEQYLNILEESLRKKIEVLDEIIAKNEEQKKILEAEEFDPEVFDQNTQEKGELIDRLELLDSGFEKVFERVKEELETNKEAHKEQILRLQDAIRTITEKSVFIQTTEERNRKTVEQKFKKEREKIQFGKNSMKVARQYYNNMRGINGGVASAFVDNKQ